MTAELRAEKLAKTTKLTPQGCGGDSGGGRWRCGADDDCDSQLMVVLMVVRGYSGRGDGGAVDSSSCGGEVVDLFWCPVDLPACAPSHLYMKVCSLDGP